MLCAPPSLLGLCLGPTTLLERVGESSRAKAIPSRQIVMQS